MSEHLKKLITLSTKDINPRVFEVIDRSKAEEMFKRNGNAIECVYHPDDSRKGSYFRIHINDNDGLYYRGRSEDGLNPFHFMMNDDLPTYEDEVMRNVLVDLLNGLLERNIIRWRTTPYSDRRMSIFHRPNHMKRGRLITSVPYSATFDDCIRMIRLNSDLLDNNGVKHTWHEDGETIIDFGSSTAKIVIKGEVR